MAENKDKKVIFSDTHIRHAQLRIRLDHDGFTQSEFFRCIVSGYLEKDQDLTPQNRVIAWQSFPWGTEMTLNKLNSKLDQKRRRVPQ